LSIYFIQKKNDIYFATHQKRNLLPSIIIMNKKKQNASARLKIHV